MRIFGSSDFFILADLPLMTLTVSPSYISWVISPVSASIIRARNASIGNHLEYTPENVPYFAQKPDFFGVYHKPAQVFYWDAFAQVFGLSTSLYLCNSSLAKQKHRPSVPVPNLCTFSDNIIISPIFLLSVYKVCTKCVKSDSTLIQKWVKSVSEMIQKWFNCTPFCTFQNRQNLFFISFFVRSEKVRAFGKGYFFERELYAADNKVPPHGAAPGQQGRLSRAQKKGWKAAGIQYVVVGLKTARIGHLNGIYSTVFIQNRYCNDVMTDSAEQKENASRKARCKCKSFPFSKRFTKALWYWLSTTSRNKVDNIVTIYTQLILPKIVYHDDNIGWQ